MLARAAVLIAPGPVSGRMTSEPIELAPLQRNGLVIVSTDPKGGAVTVHVQHSDDGDSWRESQPATLVPGGASIIDYALARGSGLPLFLRLEVTTTHDKPVLLSAVLVPVAQPRPNVAR
jgi:hypothetical protein